MRLVLVVAAIVLALPARAGVETPPTKLKIACLGIGGGEGFTPKALVTLEELLLTALDDTGRFQVIGKADVQTLLDLERRRQLAGCNDQASCLADIVGALGLRHALAADAGTLGDVKVITLKLMDTTTGEVLARAKKKVDDGDLDAAITDVVHELRAKLDARESQGKQAVSAPIAPIAPPPTAPTRYVAPIATEQEKTVVALASIARGMRELGRTKPAEKAYADVLKAYAAKKLGPDAKAAAEAAAEATFILADSRFQAFARRRVVVKGSGVALAKKLQTEVNALLGEWRALVATYEKVIAFDARPWSLAARDRIGNLDELLAAKIIGIECPMPASEFRDEQCAVWSSTLEEKIGPVDERAFATYGRVRDEARASELTNEWIAHAERRFCARHAADPTCVKAPEPR